MIFFAFCDFTDIAGVTVVCEEGIDTDEFKDGVGNVCLDEGSAVVCREGVFNVVSTEEPFLGEYSDETESLAIGLVFSSERLSCLAARLSGVSSVLSQACTVSLGNVGVASPLPTTLPPLRRSNTCLRLGNGCLEECDESLPNCRKVAFNVSDESSAKVSICTV